MSLELKILRSILQRKHHSIQRGVSFWLYFKAHFLENEKNRSILQNHKFLQLDQFRTLLRSLADPNKCGPSLCRSNVLNSSTRAVNTLDCLNICYVYYTNLFFNNTTIVGSSKISGVGLFAKSDLKEEKGRLFHEKVFGALFEVNEEDFEELEKREFPSLYSSNNQHFIMCGPASLFNNRCDHSLGFTDSLTNNNLRFRNPHEFFADIPLVFVKVVNHFSVKKNQEIFVSYSTEVVPFTCLCDTCASNISMEFDSSTEEEEEQETESESEFS